MQTSAFSGRKLYHRVIVMHILFQGRWARGWNFVSWNLTIWIAGIPFEFPVKGNIALRFNRYSQQRIYSQLLTSDVAAAQ